MSVVERRIVIEEPAKPNPSALKATVVRWQDAIREGIFIHTIPFATNYKTQAFKFMGYPERMGKITSSTDYDEEDEPLLERWEHTFDESTSPEEAIFYHDRAVDEIATCLEEGELVFKDGQLITLNNSIV
jgi:neutral trehalase